MNRKHVKPDEKKPHTTGKWRWRIKKIKGENKKWP
jgi:hypothetical protein